MWEEELQEMISVCADSFRYAVEALEENSKEKALKVIEKESQADELEIRLRADHMKRLAKNQCGTDAGIVFLRCPGMSRGGSDHSEILRKRFLRLQPRKSPDPCDIISQGSGVLNFYTVGDIGG